MVSVKLRTSQKPKTPKILVPGIRGSMFPPVVLLAMFWAMILLPASPRPMARSEPVFTIVCSSSAVSSFSSLLRYPRG